MKAVLLSVALVGAAALAGCGESKGNASGNAAGGSGAGSSMAAVFRTQSLQQCETGFRNSPVIPAGFDVASLCTCAYDGAFGGQADPAAYVSTPAGEQAYERAVKQCAEQRGVVFKQGAGSVPAPQGAPAAAPPAEGAPQPETAPAEADEKEE